MSRPDDSRLTPHELSRVRGEAERALAAADAFGRLPTPIEEVMAAAKVTEVPEDLLNEGFLTSIRRRAPGALKRALSKVIGLFHAGARLIVVDRTIHEKKQVFVRLHETGHASLPWQRDLYAVVEDCEQTIDPELADHFDREANVFASEVLFQLGSFTEEAAQHPFSIKVPLKLGRKYGASAYASIRRYVSENQGACAVLVLEPPDYIDGDGFRCRLRRSVRSQRFQEIFGEIQWPEVYTPDDPVGAVIPVGGRRMTSPRRIEIVDANGEVRDCLAEAFNSTYQVFILLHASETLRSTVVAIAG